MGDTRSNVYQFLGVIDRLLAS